MKVTIFFLVTLLLFIFSHEILYSQDQNALTFNESLQIALKNSFDLKNTEYNLIQAQKRVEAARAALKSNASFEADFPNFDESLSQEFNSEDQIYEFYKTKQLKYEGRLTINQPIATNGNFSLNSSLFRMNQSGDIKDYTSRLFLEFSQPLFTPNAQQRNIRRAELGKKMTELNYINRRLGTIHGRITRDFYNLYKSAVRVVIDSSEVVQREESYRAAREKFNKGEADEISLLELEVDLAQSKNKLLSTRASLLRRKNWFKFSIGLDFEQDFNVIPDIAYKTVGIDREKMVTEALKYEPGYQRSLIEKELDEMRIEEVQSRNEFKGNFVANFGFNGNDEYFKGAFSEYDQTRKLGMKFTVPLWDRGKNKYFTDAAKLTFQNQILETENNKTSLIRRVDDDIMRINEAAQRVEMLERSMTLAQKSFDMALEKFKNGEISSRDLTLSQERLTEARLNHLDAVVSYKINLGNLQRKTLWDFENKCSMIDDLRAIIDNIM